MESNEEISNNSKKDCEVVLINIVVVLMMQQ
jgi:hypothetical protein